jgi:class 3 adenylate cyclase
MQPNSRLLRIFLCHSSGDKPAVRELYKRLQADGFDPWLDEENLEAGQEWEKEIPKAVRNSDVVIVCLSNGSVNKRGYVQKEIKFALDVAEEQPEGSIFLVPTRLENCDVPETLGRWHRVNLFEAQGYARLLRALKLSASRIGITADPSISGEGIFGGVEQTVTVVFAGIHGYVALTESLSSPQLVWILNKFYSGMLRVITGHGGVLNHYFGNGLMALFGVPSKTPKDASNAVAAAMAMQRFMVSLTEEVSLPKLGLGLGLHTGAAIVGISGSEIRSEFTVIGQTVDLAARLETDSKPGQILISESTAIAATDFQSCLRPLPPLEVKGRAGPVPVCEVDWQQLQS